MRRFVYDTRGHSRHGFHSQGGARTRRDETNELEPGAGLCRFGGGELGK